MAVVLTKQPTTFRTLIDRKVAGEYGAWRNAPELLPIAIRERMAPAVSKAIFRLNLAAVGDHAWAWKTVVKTEDRVAIVEDPADSEAVCFAGFLQDAEILWDSNPQNPSEEVVLTVVGNAVRLARDVVVYGRHMFDLGGSRRLYEGLPCVFNAGGKPNRKADPCLAPTGYPGGAPGFFMFTQDDDPEAEFWTLGNAIDYLQWMYNDLAWVKNALLASADYARDEPLLADVEGMNLWEALAAVAARAGYDVWEQQAPDASGMPVSRIAVQRRGWGAPMWIYRPAAGGALDLGETNLFACRSAENASSAVARPIIAGGRTLYEITAALGQAWDPADLAIPAGEKAWPTKELEGNEASDYVKRYCTVGADFPKYAEAGRLWVADTDGRYAAAPLSLPTVDLATLAGETAQTWPKMLYPALPCLTCYSTVAGKPSQEVLVEMSIDNGDNWFPLTGYVALPDRLGIYIAAPNLADIGPKGEVSVEDNLFQQLAADPTQVSVRMTCSIASPNRAVEQPAATGGAWTDFDTAAWFEREALGQTRIRAASSQFTGSGLAADEADGAAALEAEADEIQQIVQRRTVEARLSIEWPTEPARLGDLVERIEGIDYSFALEQGGEPPAPRIVGIDRHLGRDTYAMDLYLETDRQMTVRPTKKRSKRRRGAPRGVLR